jgi:glutaredoxin
MKIFGFDTGGLPGLENHESAISRTEAQQREAQRAADQLALYHSPSCLYCLRVRHAIDRLAIDIELLNTDNDAEARRALVAGGGRPTVPCLRIDDDDGRRRWMYESRDIIAYLERRFAEPAA